MSEWLDLINFAAVGVFGVVLSASFCEIDWTRRNKYIFGVGCVILACLQVLLLTDFDIAGLREIYPIMTHLPLTVLLAILTRKWLWSLVSVLTAYLCCQFRRWLALLCVGIFSGGQNMQNAVEFIVTIPLLWLIIRFASPAIRGVSQQPVAMQVQFSMLPAVGYIFDYLTRIYTDWLIVGLPAATEFMLFVCAIVQIVFAIRSVEIFRRESEMEQAQAALDLQVKQSVREIDALRRAQDQAAAYRHDMRHHLQFLSACIDSGKTEQAQAYIRQLNDRLSSQVVNQYCKNPSVNLILSAFAGRAAEAGVDMTIQMRLGEEVRVADSDLCVLLSNALENALNACEAVLAQGKPAEIEVRGYEKGNRVLLEITNSCGDNIPFENDLPVTREKGHGVGVRSICAVVEKYGGIHVFETREGQFLLRLAI